MAFTFPSSDETTSIETLKARKDQIDAESSKRTFTPAENSEARYVTIRYFQLLDRTRVKSGR